jgi:hypothetical protein
MINDMASLKQAMEHMDADDAAVAQAAKDRAAQILSDARLDFAKLAELIEQRRLLLRPRILASIKRMDQPAMLGDAAFRDTGASLRKEGQSFRQIAEALELHGGTASRHEEQALRSELDHRMEFDSEREDAASPGAQPLAMHVVLYPVRHPIRFLVIAVLTVMLINALRDFAGSGRQVPGYRASVNARQHVDAAMSSVSSLLHKRDTRPPEQTGTPPTPPAPLPSASPADQAAPSSPSAGPATSPAPATASPTPSANESPLPAPSPTASASPSAPVPPPSTPSRSQARGVAPSTSGANNAPRTVRSHIFDEFTPDRLRRNSRLAGPCFGGAGGCYWGGGQY